MIATKLPFIAASLALILVSRCAESPNESKKLNASGNNNASNDLALASSPSQGRVIDLTSVEPKLFDPSLKDAKIYFSNEASPKLAFVATPKTNGNGKMTLFGRQDPLGAWHVVNISDIPGSPLAGKPINEVGDAHLRYSRDGAFAWLTFGGCLGSEPCGPRGLQLTQDLSRATQMVNLDRCGHEPQVVCNSKDDCVGLSVCDAKEDKFFGTSLKRIASGAACPSIQDADLKLPGRVSSGFGQIMTPRGNGEFDFYFVQSTLPEIFFKKETVYVARLKFEPGQCIPKVGEVLQASAAPTKLGGALFAPVVNKSAIAAYAAVGWTNAVNPSSGTGWQAQQDTTPNLSASATSFSLVSIGASGQVRGAAIPVVPPTGFHNLSPTVEFDASSGDFYVFYYQMKMGGDPNYRVCYRSWKGDGWRTEVCPVSAKYKDIRLNTATVNAQNVIENNYKVGAVSQGKIALMYQDECTGVELGDGATCRLKIWTNY